MMTQEREKSLRANYDQRVDVLYVMAGPPVDVDGEGLPNGIELDYDSENGNPYGVTVIGYLRNGWVDKVRDLSGIVANHLSIEESYVNRLIEKEIFDRSGLLTSKEAAERMASSLRRAFTLPREPGKTAKGRNKKK